MMMAILFEEMEEESAKCKGGLRAVRRAKGVV
jgi:hypothetical protein